MSEAVLQGAHILLLEDDALVNLATTEILEEMGCRVSACMRLDQSFLVIEREPPDAAVLDVNINGVMSYDLAERLHEKGTPIVFVTGYSSPTLSGKWNNFPHCYKPCDPAELKTLLITALSTGRDVGR
jgi:DNA-binding response OmpR family regulator